MNHPARLPLLALLGFTSLLPLGLRAQAVYINETFEDDTIGVAPSDAAQKTAVQTLTAAGSGVIGTDNVAHLNDTTSPAGGGGMEYNVGSSALGSLFISFDLFNNAGGNTGTAANPVIFGVSNWNSSSSTLLGANANRAFGLEFYQTGLSSTVRIRVGSTVAHSGTYDMAALINVSIFINDSDTGTLNYVMPGTSTTATLNANSAVIFLNNTLVGTETSAGFIMSMEAGSGNTTGDATLGRLGFNSSSTSVTNFLVDNLYVSEVSAVPEPSATAALAGLGILGFALSRRRRRV